MKRYYLFLMFINSKSNTDHMIGSIA